MSIISDNPDVTFKDFQFHGVAGDDTHALTRNQI